MEIIEIPGANRFETWSEHRVACRGIVVRGDKLLLSFEEKTGQYVLPGGGLEAQETIADCCRREVAEETGVLVSVGERYLDTHEFYEEWFFETHFFICQPIGETEQKLTPREQQVGTVPKWLNIDEALSVFSKHQDYAETNEERRGIYLREYTALKAYVEKNKA